MIIFVCMRRYELDNCVQKKDQKSTLHFIHGRLTLIIKKMHMINTLATRRGAKPPFSHVRPLAPDNGERFMSAYHSQLKEIEDEYSNIELIREGSERCPCDKCYRNSNSLPHSSKPTPTTGSKTPKRKRKQQQKATPSSATIITSYLFYKLAS